MRSSSARPRPRLGGSRHRAAGRRSHGHAVPVPERARAGRADRRRRPPAFTEGRPSRTRGRWTRRRRPRSSGSERWPRCTTRRRCGGCGRRAAFGGKVPQVGVFDTAFFADLPAVATRCLHRGWRRTTASGATGFHGLAHAFLWRRWRRLGGTARSRAITLQLGGGCSVTATAGSQPVDTSMGFSPAEGLVMATRSGDLDPNALLHLQRHGGMDFEALYRLVNGGSGLKGMAGTADLRELLSREDAAARGPSTSTATASASPSGPPGHPRGRGGDRLRRRRRRERPGDPPPRLEGMEWCGIRLDPAANDAAVGTEACISVAEKLDRGLGRASERGRPHGRRGGGRARSPDDANARTPGMSSPATEPEPSPPTCSTGSTRTGGRRTTCRSGKSTCSTTRCCASR